MVRDKGVESLLLELIAWRRGQPLAPLLERVQALALHHGDGDDGLALGVAKAREALIDAVEAFLAVPVGQVTHCDDADRDKDQLPVPPIEAEQPG